MKNVSVLPIENSELRQSSEEGDRKEWGKKKPTTIKRLLVPGALLIQICYLFHFLNNHVKSQIACPDSLVHHRDNTGTQNYLSPKPCPSDLPELSGTHFVKPL